MAAYESTRPDAARKASQFHCGVIFIGSKFGSSLKILGKTGAIVAAVGLAWHANERYIVNQFFDENLTTEVDEDGEKKRKPMKRVLVLPFDNLKLVEERKSGGLDLNGVWKKAAEIKELVDIWLKGAAAPFAFCPSGALCKRTKGGHFVLSGFLWIFISSLNSAVCLSLSSPPTSTMADSS
jgi:hypothetical protein